MENRGIKYTIGEYAESANGKIFIAIKTVKCDSDSQAEHEARRVCEDTGEAGYTIQRGNVEWYSRA